MFSVMLHRDGHASEEAHVYSLAEASATVTAFQRKYDMGARDMGSFHGEVHVGGRLTNVVSYNGRVWGRDGSKGFKQLVFDPASK